MLCLSAKHFQHCGPTGTLATNLSEFWTYQDIPGPMRHISLDFGPTGTLLRQGLQNFAPTGTLLGQDFQNFEPTRDKVSGLPQQEGRWLAHPIPTWGISVVSALHGS